MNHVCCEVIQHNTKVNHIASNYSDYMDSMEKKLTSKQTLLYVKKKLPWMLNSIPKHMLKYLPISEQQAPK